MLLTIVSTIVVLGVLIFVHELGHFLVARKTGVTVLKFSLGFGPKLWSIQRGATQYQISFIPLGGYVKMLGEEPEEAVPAHLQPQSFSHQPVKTRFAIVLAGPAANLLLAVVVFASIFAISGIPEITTEIGSVTSGSPAAKAGLRPGDEVLEINGYPIRNWDDLSEMIRSHGKEDLTLKIKRNSQILEVVVCPQVRKVKNIFGETVERPLIGVTASGRLRFRHVNPFMAIYYSVVQTWNLCALFFITVIKLIERVLPMESVGGPILIAQMAGQQAQQGLLNFLNFLAFISVNLAVLNLLPIPVLDGGHLFLFVLEAIFRRPLSMRVVRGIQQVGLAIIITLMILVFYNDIKRIVFKNTNFP